MLRKSTCTYVGFLFIASSCASNGTAHPSSTPQPKEVTAKSPNASSWKPEVKAGTQAYVIRDSAFITVGADTTRTLPIETTTYISLLVSSHADSLELNGRIDSLIRSSNQQMTRDTTVSQEHHFATSVTGHLTSMPSSTSIDCTKKTNLSDVRVSELFASYPTQLLKIGDKWSDTISTISCHGKTALNQQSIREFELLELTSWKEKSSAKIRRTVTSVISNTSRSPTSQLTAIGNGSGFSLLYVDVMTGALLESIGQSQSKLVVTTARGVFPFLQTIHTEIKLAN